MLLHQLEMNQLTRVASFIQILALIGKNERFDVSLDKYICCLPTTKMCPDGFNVFEEHESGYLSLNPYDRNNALTYDFIDLIIVLIMRGEKGPFGVSILSLWQIHFNIGCSATAEEELEWIALRFFNDFDMYSAKIYPLLTIQ